MKKKTGMMGLMAVVLMMGIQVGASVIVYDGFDTAVAADAANGIYESGASFSNAANNAVVGGSIIGFQASDTWTASLANMQPLDGKGALLPSWTTEASATRKITPSMVGKTVAYGSATISMSLNYSNATYVPTAHIGFSDETFSSYDGAGIGFQWNDTKDGWDVNARYRSGGAWAFNDVATGYGTDTGDIFVIWKMDQVNDTLSVWINPADTNASPTVVFTDFEGAVSSITHMNALTYRVSQTAATGGFRYDDLKLGDEMADVIKPPPSPLAYDGFDTAVTADAANGIYESGASFSNAANNAVVGGSIIGFQASDTWTASSALMQPLDGKGALLPAWVATVSATRKIKSSMIGKTVAYGSATISMSLNYSNATYVPTAHIGFSDETFSSYDGAGIGFQWNDTKDGWDINARYRSGGAWAFNDVATGYGTDTGDIFVVWKMDQVNDTLSVWVNPANSSALPTAVFTDFEGGVSSITHMNALTYRVSQTAATGGFRFDDLTLGDTMEIVIPEQAVGYAGWADGWGVDIGASTNDYDSDGLLNLYEYGLGGDPTDALDQGIPPEFGIMTISGTNWFGYVHPQRSEPNSGLSYFLELNTDLVLGPWTNAGYMVLGTNVTGGVLDFVTNVTDTVAGEKFVRLIIE